MNWFKRHDDIEGVNDTFVTLIRVAQEDDGVRKTLMTILSLPPFHRKSMLNTMINEMKMKSSPADFVAAIACLLDDEIAERAIGVLKE
ncbi:MAG: hypothetical protein EPN22_14165 [Nitrospirae bacterium]|nr:MAG: hypothetical protein EPN22_14165 [Nitrospirota bacterium]